MSKIPSPTITVVVVNYNGRDFLLPCLQSVLDQDYPQDEIEIVLIDNASTDGSVEEVRRLMPTVQIIVNDANVGFSPAVNQGARAGNGEYLALLNNDAIAEPQWLRNGIAPMILRKRVACTASLMLSDDGQKVDWAGGAAMFTGHGIATAHGDEIPDDLEPGTTLFACGGAMITRRDVFLKHGGFDDDYFAYYEDVDYGWRLWILGYEVWFTPTSRVRHRHHGTISKFGKDEKYGNVRERYLLERNALMTVYKNWSDESIPSILPATMLLAAARSATGEDTEIADYRIESAVPGELPALPKLSPYAGANLAAVRDFALSLEKLAPKRAHIQAHRARADRDLVPLLKAAVVAHTADQDYLDVFKSVTEAFKVPLTATARQKVLILCADTIGPKMAGPAIRAWEMAKLLSFEHEVTLAALTKPQLTHERFKVEHCEGEAIRLLINHADVIVFQGMTMYMFPEIGAVDAAVVADIYDPFHIEALEHRKHESPYERWMTNMFDTQIINDQLVRADLMLCASPKQRDFWLGQLAALGRINPATYDQHPGLEGLLEIAPFGLPPEPPVQTRHAIRDEIDGIDHDDLVLIWGGGVYDWFDPSTLIRGVALAAKENPKVKLFFLGIKHPNPAIPMMARAREAIRTAEDLGIRDTHVFFNEGWVDYDDRHNYLCDADIGVSTHFLHIETELSFRTRILDYLWAGLPILATEGDSLSNMVTLNDLGEVVKAENAHDIARAILALADDKRRAECRARVEELAPTMTWERALEPLLAFCRMPRRAADLEGRKQYPMGGMAKVAGSPRRLAKRFVEVTQEEGLKEAVSLTLTNPKIRNLANKLRG